MIGSPVAVSVVIDGATDYPVALGRQTYQDSIFRSWAAGNITSDPTNPAHLALVWSDMRNSPAPAADLNPYESTTNSDLIVSESTAENLQRGGSLAPIRARQRYIAG